MQLDVVYSLWSLKPCIEFLIVLHRTFRNPASGHRPSRGQLQTAMQDLTGIYIHEPLRLMKFDLNRLIHVLSKFSMLRWQHHVSRVHKTGRKISFKYVFFV